MRYNQIPPFLCALLLFWSSQGHLVEGISRCNQHMIAGASIRPRFTGSYRQRPSLLLASSRKDGSQYSIQQRTIPLARTKKTKKTSKESSKVKAIEEESQSEDPFAVPRTTQDIYAELGPIGRVVAGTVEVGFSVVFEYLTGFMGGYVIGSITDVPRFVYKSAAEEGQRLTFLQELSQRYGRMHGKSFRWAKTWAGISAAFGGLRVATRVARGGKDDEWNTIISSAAAGAFFARKEGPQAMVRGALTYGGMMYLFSGGLGKKKDVFEYQDQPVQDF